MIDRKFKKILEKMVSEQRDAFFLETKKFKFILFDYARNEFKKECSLLVTAHEAGCLTHIDTTGNLEKYRQSFVKRLEDEYNISPVKSAEMIDLLFQIFLGRVIEPYHFEKDERYETQKKTRTSPVSPAPRLPVEVDLEKGRQKLMKILTMVGMLLGIIVVFGSGLYLIMSVDLPFWGAILMVVGTFVANRIVTQSNTDKWLLLGLFSAGSLVGTVVGGLLGGLGWSWWMLGSVWVLPGTRTYLWFLDQMFNKVPIGWGLSLFGLFWGGFVGVLVAGFIGEWANWPVIAFWSVFGFVLGGLSVIIVVRVLLKLLAGWNNVLLSDKVVPIIVIVCFVGLILGGFWLELEFSTVRSIAMPKMPDTWWYVKNSNSSTFKISNAVQLAGLARIVNEKRDYFEGKTITLTGNIDLSLYDNWTPIGTFDFDDGVKSHFLGIFDGAGYTISNLTINRPDADVQGLFGRILGGRVENLKLDSVNIYGRDYVGGLAGYVGFNCSVSNIYSTGTINGNEGIGGIAGFVNRSSVANSYSTGTVSGTNLVGGIAGSVSDSSGVANSYSTGAVSGTDNIGGIVGFVSRSSVANSYSLGTISGTNLVGGIAGGVSDSSGVANSYSTGAVSGTDGIGGIVGFVSRSSVANSYSLGAISGTNLVGGIAGGVSDSSGVANSYSTGAVSGTDGSIGGVVGWVSENSSMINNVALNPEVKGVISVGRVAGSVTEGSTLSNNAAYIRIRNNNGNTRWNNKGLATLNGADISASAIISDGSIGGRFTNANGWVVESGHLPGFGKSVAMPSHIQTN